MGSEHYNMISECHGILDMYMISIGGGEDAQDQPCFISKNMILGPIGFNMLQFIAMRLERWRRADDHDAGHGYILPQKQDGCPQCGDTRKHYHRDTPDGEEVIYG